MAWCRPRWVAPPGFRKGLEASGGSGGKILLYSFQRPGVSQARGQGCPALEAGLPWTFCNGREGQGPAEQGQPGGRAARPGLRYCTPGRLCADESGPGPAQPWVAGCPCRRLLRAHTGSLCPQPTARVEAGGRVEEEGQARHRAPGPLTSRRPHSVGAAAGPPSCWGPGHPVRPQEGIHCDPGGGKSLFRRQPPPGHCRTGQGWQGHSSVENSGPRKEGWRTTLPGRGAPARGTSRIRDHPSMVGCTGPSSRGAHGGTGHFPELWGTL